MLLWKDLEKLEYLNQEIDYLEKKINNYRPAEVVIDSVVGSASTFPYVQHRFTIEGIEKKPEVLTIYINRLRDFKQKLYEERARVELEIEKIPFAEIRMIIRYRYIDRFTYVQIMHLMKYNNAETPRIKLKRYMSGTNE